MARIERGAGSTASESYLASLADKTFLDLWSYPNTFIDKKQNSVGAGKELCDLLVVCGDDIIIFSDKAIEWPVADNIDIAWSRWYRRAVANSVKQINGAVRWIDLFPDRIFIDPECQHRLPIALPDKEKRRVHGIVVSNGSNAACREHYDDVSGTLVINPDLEGTSHTDTKFPKYAPFSIGDVNPGSAFVHVFDGEGLTIVLRELDTITDFVQYINKREKFIRSGRLAMAAGEEDLLAHYLSYVARNGKHDFLLKNHKAVPRRNQLLIQGGTYTRFQKLPQYTQREEANKISYAWDGLISSFTTHILAGTNVAILENQPLGTFAEPGLRLMATETRTSRRALGHHLIECLNIASQMEHDRFNRTILPMDKFDKNDVAFIICIFAYDAAYFSNAGGYDAYRRMRIGFLEVLCLSTLYEYRSLKNVVAVGLDKPDLSNEHQETSQDMVAAEQTDWDEDSIKSLLETRRQLNIKSPRELTSRTSSVKEFPTGSPIITAEMSRQERRKLFRQFRKDKR